MDFVGVNVTVNESRNRVRRWVERERPPYRTLYDETGLAVRTFEAPVTSYVVILDARGVISVQERQSYILRIRELAKECGAAWLQTAGGGAE